MSGKEKGTLTQDDVETIASMVSCKISVSVIAAFFNVDRSSIYYHRRRIGLSTERRRAKIKEPKIRKERQKRKVEKVRVVASGGERVCQGFTYKEYVEREAVRRKKQGI